MNAHELKNLQVRFVKVKADYDALVQEQQALIKKVGATQRLMYALQEQITLEEQKNVEPIVTEHALLRWVERVHGINLDQVKAEILDARTVEAIKFAGSGNYTTPEGVKLVFKDKRVVTVET